jgi:hypothetical protein
MVVQIESTRCYKKEADMRSMKPISIPKRLVVGIIVLFFALTLIANSQERDSVQLIDTSKKSPQSIYPRSLFVELPFYHPPSLSFLHQPLPGALQPNFWTVRDKIDLVSPWKLELANQEEFQTWKNILGAMELGGVAYIGYEHIRKYGLK